MAATGRCVCEGHWRHRLVHWVVTQRKTAIVEGEEVKSNYCELKCRVCYKKWRTKARYTQQLSNYVERKYKRLTYQAILQLIRCDRLRVDFDTGTVSKERKRFGKWTGEMLPLSSRLKRDHDGDGAEIPAHRYVVLCDDGRRREISQARLAWMIFHKRVIPKGYDVDHDDDDPANNAIDNLIVVELSINRGGHDHDNNWDEVPF